MNKPLSILFFLLLSFLLITMQSTVLSPRVVGGYSADFNLILLVFFAIYVDFKWGIFLTIINGLFMDVLAGNFLGTFTISGICAFLLIRIGSENVYLKRILVQALVIFLTTIFTWTFILSVITIKEEGLIDFSLRGIMTQSLVNALVGLMLFWVIIKVNAKLQK